MNPLGALVDEHADRGLVAEAGSGAQRVGEVQVGRVLVAGQHGGDAALRPARRRLLELALGEHADAGSAELGETDRRRQARHAAPDHEDVERLRLSSRLPGAPLGGRPVSCWPPGCRSAGPARRRRR